MADGFGVLVIGQPALIDPLIDCLFPFILRNRLVYFSDLDMNLRSKTYYTIADKDRKGNELLEQVHY